MTKCCKWENYALQTRKFRITAYRPNVHNSFKKDHFAISSSITSLKATAKNYWKRSTPEARHITSPLLRENEGGQRNETKAGNGDPILFWIEMNGNKNGTNGIEHII